MFQEYGYMEEGKLGKPYDFRLLRRLAPYAAPYARTIAWALFLTLLITLFDLVVPYLSKIAIDRYILASWYRIETEQLSETEERKGFMDRYGQLLVKSGDGSFHAVSHGGLRDMDPVNLFSYRSRGILKQEKLYRTRINARDFISSGVLTMADGSFLVPHGILKTLPADELLRIRADDIRGVTLMGGIFLVLVILVLGLSYLQYYLLEYIGQHIMQDIRISLFHRMQSQAMRFFLKHPLGRLVTRATNDIENLNEMFKSVFVTLFKDIFLLAGILAVLIYLNWRMALVSFVLLPFIFGITLLFSTLAREAFRELRASVAKINAFLQERLTGMRVIQLFVREKFHMENFTRINHENYAAGMKQIRVFAVFMPIMELFSSFAVALIIWYGGGRVIQEQLTLGSLVAFLGYIQMFFKPIRDISEKYNIMQSAMASTERIFEFMDLREEIPEPEKDLGPSRVKGRLVFKEVSFSYDKGIPVLHDISFEIKPGETVAIVGATGSGKTTLVNLVERLYDPDRGEVYLDGADLRVWSKGRLRNSMGLCMQDVFVFGGTVSDNISLGRERVDDRAMEEAARKVNALSFIRRLPKGFQQDTGEGGGSLSAGERQLLSFARALAADPRILILDEATSSIDPETEHLIQEAISRMTEKRTTLVVAHRLSTIRNADRILVMHHGRIVEEGSHGDLMALKGIYYRLHMLRDWELGD
jgi:ATP-binding cassette, subfamily B, multidrug efflux pump